MFEEFDKVKIISRGIVGTIVDKTEKNGVYRYIVESDTKGKVPGLDGGEWPLYDCEEYDLLPIEDNAAYKELLDFAV